MTTTPAMSTTPAAAPHQAARARCKAPRGGAAERPPAQEQAALAADARAFGDLAHSLAAQLAQLSAAIARQSEMLAAQTALVDAQHQETGALVAEVAALGRAVLAIRPCAAARQGAGTEQPPLYADETAVDAHRPRRRSTGSDGSDYGEL